MLTSLRSEAMDGECLIKKLKINWNDIYCENPIIIKNKILMCQPPFLRNARLIKRDDEVIAKIARKFIFKGFSVQ